MRTFLLRLAVAGLVMLPASLISTTPALASAAAAGAVSPGGVLVIGASGDAGSEFIKHLANDVGPITAFLRATSNLRLLGGRDLRFVVGDVQDPASVASAILATRPRVIFISMNARRGEPYPFVAAAQAVIGPARAVGVQQIIWIGQAGASKDGVVRGFKDINYGLFEDILGGIGAGEKVLVDSGLPVTVIRVGAIIIEGAGLGGVHPETGNGYLVENEKVFGPIAYGDLGRLAAQCAGNSRCIGKTFHATDDSLGDEYGYWRCNRFTDAKEWAAKCPTTMTEMVDGQFR